MVTFLLKKHLKIFFYLGCPVKFHETLGNKLGNFKIALGYLLVFIGVLIGFKGVYWVVMIEKKFHFLHCKKIFFEGKDIKKELVRGKITLTIINGFFMMFIVQSNLIIIYQINFLCKNIFY